MKAIIYKRYGPPDVLQIAEVEKPAPGENQVLVKVHAASINAGDYRTRRADPFFIRLMAGLLKPKDPRQGIYVCAGGTMPQFMQAILLGSLMSRKGGKKTGTMGIARVNQADLVYLGELLEAGKIASVIDRRYPLNEIVAAFRYLDDTHAQGKVVITMV